VGIGAGGEMPPEFAGAGAGAKPGQRNACLRISQPPAKAKGSQTQIAQYEGQNESTNSENEAGGGIFWSRMTGLPNLRIASPRKSPKARVKTVNELVCFGLIRLD